jgi:uncharacterized protein
MEPTVVAPGDGASKSEQAEWWASPVPIGLMAVALTSILVGLTNLPSPYGHGFANGWTVLGMAVAFGGITQFFAGIIALRKGDMFHGLAFVSYGAFWEAFVLMNTTYAPTPSTSVLMYGSAAFTFVWMLFTFTILINTPKFGRGIVVSVTLLFFAFMLLGIKSWQLGAGTTLSSAEQWLIGGEIIATGLSFWYVATAKLTNWNYGRTVLPT